MHDITKFITKLINSTKDGSIKWYPLITYKHRLLPTIDEKSEYEHPTIAYTISSVTDKKVLNKRSFYCKIDTATILLISKSDPIAAAITDPSIFLFWQGDSASYSKELCNTINSENEVIILLKRLRNVVEYYDPKTESSFDSFMDSFLNE